MNKICKICRKKVANPFGYCPDCWNDMGENLKNEIKQFNREKHGRAEPKIKLSRFLKEDSSNKEDKRYND